MVTDDGTFEADILVVALGADLNPAATPGLVGGGHEFYSVPGAFALRDLLPRFGRGAAIIGVTGKAFKCPPAPSEAALLLHDYLVVRGRREATEISVVMPFGTPIPPSPETSRAILAAFAERSIRFVKDSLVRGARAGPEGGGAERRNRNAVRTVPRGTGASRPGGRCRVGTCG